MKANRSHKAGKKSPSPKPSARPRKLWLVVLLIAVVALTVWVGWPEQPSTIPVAAGPRIQPDAPEDQPGLPIELRTDPEPIEMLSLEGEMLKQAEVLEHTHPSSAMALDLAASVYYDLNRLPEADRLWIACMDLRPTESEFYVSYAGFLSNNERVTEAIQLLEAAHARKIETAGTYHQLAVAYERSGNLQSAISISQEVNSRFPQFGESWLLTGKICNQLGKFVEAESALRKSLDLEQAESSVLPVLVTVLAKQGKRQEAADLRDRLKSIVQQPQSAIGAEPRPFQERFEESLRNRAARLFYLAAVIEKQARNSQASAQLAMRSHRLLPTNAGPLVLLAELMVSNQRFAEALKITQRLVIIEPENPAHFVNLASMAYRLGQPDVAHDALQQGVQTHPDIVVLQLSFAKSLVSRNRPLEARAVIEKLLANAQHPEAYMILATTYQQTGNITEANQAFERARKLSATNQQAEASN